MQGVEAERVLVMSHQVEPTGTGTELPPAAPQTELPKRRDRRRLIIGGLVAGGALMTLANRSALAQPTGCASILASLQTATSLAGNAAHRACTT